MEERIQDLVRRFLVEDAEVPPMLKQLIEKQYEKGYFNSFLDFAKDEPEEAEEFLNKLESYLFD